MSRAVASASTGLRCGRAGPGLRERSIRLAAGLPRVPPHADHPLTDHEEEGEIDKQRPAGPVIASEGAGGILDSDDDEP